MDGNPEAEEELVGAMQTIQERIKIHDRHQFEIKHVYPLSSQNGRALRYTVELYLFIPQSLDINPESRRKEEFYRDLQSRIRWQTPVCLLESLLCSEESILARLRARMSELGRRPDDPKVQERFVDTLAADFPQCREELKQYVGLLRQVGGNIRATLRPDAQGGSGSNTWFGQSAYDYLRSTISHPTLRRVLSGASLTMELAPDTLPLYIFAQINHSFIQSTWRLQGGGQQIADRLAAGITARGGTVRTRARVVRLVEAGQPRGAPHLPAARHGVAQHVRHVHHPPAAAPGLCALP